MKRYVLATLGLALALAASPGHAQPSAQPRSAEPRYVEATAFRPPQLTPQPFRMSRATQRSVAEAVRALPRFPDYLYSGCHDRAHAAYMLLPDSLVAYATKVWLFSPERLTFVVPGTISLRENRDRRSTEGVRWGYHVALSFLDAKGNVLVFDPALAPGRLIAHRDWLALMRIPEHSIWTRWQAPRYLFFSTDSTMASPGRVFNGGTFGYTPSDSARIKHFIPRALARDAVGEALLRDGGCDALRSIATKPGLLQSELEKDGLPAECAAQKELYTREVERWKQVLGEAEQASAQSGSPPSERT